MANKTHNDEESDRKIRPAKVRPELFGGDKTFDALTKLRGIRKLGKGKLSLREAIAAARQQVAAYEQSLREGSPIRRVQVWVESRLVITFSADEDSANLKAFHFDVGSPREAVLQIVKADEGQEPIVLLNLPLSTVSSRKVVEISPLPNAQQIRLEIVPQESGRFDVKVSIVAEGEAPTLPAERPLIAKGKATAGGSKRMSNNNWPYHPGILQPVPNRGTWAPPYAAIVVLLCAALGFGIAFPWARAWFAAGERVTAAKNNVQSEACEQKSTKQKRPEDVQVARSRQKGGRNQQAQRPAQTSTEAPESSATVAERELTTASVVEKEGETPVVDSSVGDVNNSAQTSTPTRTINPVGERVGLESRESPSSVAYSQNRLAEPLNYSGANRQYPQRRLRTSYAERSGFSRRQRD